MKEKFLALIKKPAAWIISGVLLVSFILMLLSIISPAPREDGGFSAAKAYTHVEAIGGLGPHSVFDQKFVTGGTENGPLDNVRDYIQTSVLNNLQPIGGSVIKISHSNVFLNDVGTNPITKNIEVPVINYYAEIKGKSNSSVLLMAHYDSAPHRFRDGVYIGKSSGAGDDAYGVATLLEVMRLAAQQVAAGKQLENGIKFLFTDAEEPWPYDESLSGLFGSTAALAEYNSWFDGVNIVINVEARGMRGPLFMFQTSAGNKALINLFRSANNSFSFSVASDVYAILDTDTDFSPFLRAGYSGMNFSVLDSLKEYHAPGDNVSNVSKGALQEYGDQIYPIVEEYLRDAKYADPDYFKSGTDMVFFTFLPFLFISYSQVFSWILIAALLVGAGVAVFYAHKNKLINLKKSLLALALWFSFILAGAVAGLILSLLLALIFGMPFNFMNTALPFGLGFLIIFILGLVVAAYFMLKLFKKLDIRFFDAFAGIIFLLLTFTLLTGFFLHGGTYLFLWPAAFMAGFLGLRAAPVKKPWAHYAKYVLAGLGLFVSFILYCYLLYSLFLALSFGALAAHLLFAGIFAGLMITIGGSHFEIDGASTDAAADTATDTTV